jgi:leucyl-tRNA synthetase
LAGADMDELSKLKQLTHQTIKKVTLDMEGDFHFNTAISSIMELMNFIYSLLGKNPDSRVSCRENIGAVKESVRALLLLLAPFVPHISEELWQLLGNKESIFRNSWPEFNENVLKKEVIQLVIQVNGKVRSKIKVSSQIGKEELKELVLRDEKIKRHITNSIIKDFIVVPNRLINIVI